MATPKLDTAVCWGRAKDYTTGDYVTDGSGNGRNALLGSAEGADTNDPLFLSPDSYASYASPGTQYLYTPAVNGNGCTGPAWNTLGITDEAFFQFRVRLASWSPAASIMFCSVDGWPLQIFLRAGGTLRLLVSPDGVYANRTEFTSSAAVGAAANALLWIGVKFQGDNGAGGSHATFYTGGSGTSPSWSQLGNVIDGAATTGIQAVTTAFYLWGGGSSLLNGGFDGAYRARLYNDLTETNCVFDADFTDRTSVTAASATFTEASTNAATVTINRSTTGRKSTVVDYPQFLLGTDDFLEIADHADLDFAAAESMTALVVVRSYRTSPAADMVWLGKKDNLTTAAGWAIYNDTTGVARALIADGTADDEDDAPAISDGALLELGMVRNGTATTVEAYLNGTGSGSAETDTTTATLANALPVRIGATSGTAASFFDGVVYGWAIWRSVVSGADLAIAADELMGDEVPMAEGTGLITGTGTLEGLGHTPPVGMAEGTGLITGSGALAGIGYARAVPVIGRGFVTATVTCRPVTASGVGP